MTRDRHFRHLGAVIGSEKFKDEYVSKRVAGWIKDVNKLSRFAIEYLQSAYYIAYTKGMSSRWTFVHFTENDLRCNTSKLSRINKVSFDSKAAPARPGRVGPALHPTSDCIIRSIIIITTITALIIII